MSVAFFQLVVFSQAGDLSYSCWISSLRRHRLPTHSIALSLSPCCLLLRGNEVLRNGSILKLERGGGCVAYAHAYSTRRSTKLISDLYRPKLEVGMRYDMHTLARVHRTNAFKMKCIPLNDRMVKRANNLQAFTFTPLHMMYGQCLALPKENTATPKTTECPSVCTDSCMQLCLQEA